MNKIYGFIVLLISITGNVYAAATPIPKIKDHRIREIAYDSSNITVLNSDYNVKTTVEFSPGEEIIITTCGKPTMWDILPSQAMRNLITIQPTAPNADTNLTIVTNQRTYLFELRADDKWDLKDEDITFYLRFRYPNEVDRIMESMAVNRLRQKEEGLKAEIAKQKKEKEARLSPDKIFLGYSFSGDDETSPLAMFDDGKFTYIQFQKNADLPAVYEVDNDLSETILNYRIEEPYMVIERIAKRFSIRNGNKVTTVKRDKDVLSRKKNHKVASTEEKNVIPVEW